MGKPIHLSRTLLTAALFTGLTFSGCFSQQEEEMSYLTLEVRPFPTPYYVNVTSSDLDQYPILAKLFQRWEQGNGVGFSEPYPHYEALVIVNQFQNREPAGYWRPSTVVLAYQDTFFDLIALTPPEPGAA